MENLLIGDDLCPAAPAEETGSTSRYSLLFSGFQADGIIENF